MVKEKVFGSNFRNCVGLLLKLQSSQKLHEKCLNSNRLRTLIQ